MDEIQYMILDSKFLHSDEVTTFHSAYIWNRLESESSELASFATAMLTPDG